jgi:cellobiose phosphorylase
MNDCDYETGFAMEQNGQLLKFMPVEENEKIRSAYPHLTFYMEVSGASFALNNEARLLSVSRVESSSLVLFEVEATDHFSVTIQGSLCGDDYVRPDLNLKMEKERYHQFLQKVLNNFSLQSRSSEELKKIDTISWWYAHNMLVHYLMPHGLEQYGGAAWGTRDVCQGPFEFFMATQHHEVARNILERVYSHQYVDDGNWPQWFMFDRYSKIQFDESHGDIIVWPMKALSDYLYATGDYSVLDQSVPYTKRTDHQFTDESCTLFHHLKKEIQYVTSHFLYHTHLSCYGNGDWDDTLQPYDSRLKKQMASSWTVALTYQTIKRLGSVLESYDQAFAKQTLELSDAIRDDYLRYVLSDSVIPGFIYMPEEGKTEFMIHPRDEKTGIQYRLLPMTRSIISELFTPEQAEEHVKIIQKHLRFPDGVRLMNKPAIYQGGVSVHFKRAEQAANFGREIGLMYVHAHVRYIEAMAKLGDAAEVWQSISEINPITITQVVKNAGIRQSNTYFSSSDAAFNTRYEAQQQFEELHQGKIQVKGGWRIYSSGPGIFMNQLITNCLGIREKNRGLIIDPVLTEEHDGLVCHFTIQDKLVRFVYHKIKNERERILINGCDVPYDQTDNRYRGGGMYVKQEIIEQQLGSDHNTIDVYYHLK